MPFETLRDQCQRVSQSPLYRPATDTRAHLGETCDVALDLRRQVRVGCRTRSPVDDLDHALQLRRDADVLESDILGEGGEQVLVLLEGVRVNEADGDRSVALFVKLEQVSSRLLDV